MKKIRVLIFFLIGLYMISCQERETIRDGKMSFGQNSCYKLDSEEKYCSVIDSTLMDKYAVFYNFDAIQMPINRVVVRSNDTLFIALLVNGGIDKLKQAHKTVSTHKILNTKEENETVSYFLQRDNLYNFRYIYKNESSDLIFLFNYIGQDSSHIHKLYSSEDYVTDCTSCEF
ncbi:MAG: hypothetical protein GY827_00325 [Cytophagales bacterium]|nr:hypothetical protein [Cytophagales bacterium]